MEYQVSARRWRPQRFEEIVGQGHITKTLQNAIKNNRIAHAYLFSGSRGVGKTTAARIFAKALNCINGPAPEPCNNCDSCKEITAGVSTDVFEIDGASNTGVDDVRELRENIKYAPMRGKYRVYIIDEVHMLSGSAFNALLKTLEEPPAHAIFIFATTEVYKIPETVLSRCQHFNFKRLTLLEIINMLRSVCEKDGIDINENGLSVIAKAADGSMRDSLSILDQVVSFCGKKVDEKEAAEILGIINKGIIVSFINGLKNKDASALLKIIRELQDYGHDVRQFCNSLIEQIRNMIVAKVAAAPENLIDLAKDDVDEIKRLAQDFSQEEIQLLFTIFLKTQEEIRWSQYPWVSVEMASVRAVHIPSFKDIDKVIQWIGNSSKNLSDNEAETALPITPLNSKKENPAESTEEPAAYADPPAVNWEEFVNRVKEKKQYIGTYLEHGRLVDANSGEFIIGFSSKDSVFIGLIEKEESKRILKEILNDMYHRDIRLRFVKIAAESNGSNEASEKEGQSLNPLVQDALNIFGGKIVDMRKI
ncbi:MAG: DNA polymerase III subunit gamma/tau [Nitrospirota bacterium]